MTQGAQREYTPQDYIDKCREVLAEDPQHKEALFHLGFNLIKLGQYEEAIPPFEDFCQFHGDHSNVSGNLAVAYYVARRDLEKAEHYAREAIRTEPGLHKARLLIVGILMDHGRETEALVLLDDGIALGAGELDSNARHYPRLWQRKAECLLRAGFASSAGKFFNDAVAEFPDHAEIRACYAQYCAELGNVGEAAEHYRAAIALAPGTFAIRSDFAQMYFEKARFDDAYEEIKRAEEAYARYLKSSGSRSRPVPNIALRKATICLKLQKHDEAQDAVAQARSYYDAWFEYEVAAGAELVDQPSAQAISVLGKIEELEARLEVSLAREARAEAVLPWQTDEGEGPSGLVPA